MYDKEKTPPAVSINGYRVVVPNNATATKQALFNTGPLIIVVAASNWVMYDDGVFDGCSYNDTAPVQNLDLNHLVVLTGWGKVRGLNVWHVRNSWGPSWGDRGYINLLMEDDG